MCVRACDIALRKCYGVLYLVCEMDLFYSIHIATYRSLCQVDCCFFFLSSSVVWHAIIDRYRYLFSYRILQTTRNQTQHLQDKMCVIKKNISSSAEQNWKTSYCLALSMLLNQRDYRNSIEHCYDNMNDIHSNQNARIHSTTSTRSSTETIIWNIFKIQIQFFCVLSWKMSSRKTPITWTINFT